MASSILTPHNSCDLTPPILGTQQNWNLVLPYLFNYLFLNQSQSPFSPPEHRPWWEKWNLTLISK